MRKLTVAAFVSLDGVMQAPGGPQETPGTASRTAAGPGRLERRAKLEG